jgi:hypothetical protein
MEVNRLFTDRRKFAGHVDGLVFPVEPVERPVEHEAVEMSLSDEGMCFSSKVRHAIGTVLQVDFAPAASDNDHSLRSEAVVVDCRRGGHGYEITVIFTGN